MWKGVTLGSSSFGNGLFQSLMLSNQSLIAVNLRKCNVFCGLTGETCCGQQSVTGSAEITERVLYDDNIDLISIAGNIWRQYLSSLIHHNCYHWNLWRGCVVCFLCFPAGWIFIMMHTKQLFMLDSVWTKKVAYRWAFNAVSLSVKRV